MPERYRLTKSERIARERLLYLQMLDADLPILPYNLDEETPAAWHTLVHDIDCVEPKEKITLYLDRSVARAFRAMGKGYQARINWLLATWLQMKVAGILQTRRRIAELREEIDAKDCAAEEAGIRSPGIGAMVERWPREDPPED